MDVKINEKTGEVVITGRIGEDQGPFASASGKSVLLLNSGGSREVDGVTYKGAQVSLNLNLTVPHPDAPPKKDKAEKTPKVKVQLK